MVCGSLPRTSDSNLITRPLISWSSLVKCSLVNTDFRINIWCLSTCMLIIKLSCTVNSKYISDSKYEMGSKLLYVFSSSAARWGKACVTKQGLMVTCIFMCILHSLFSLSQKSNCTVSVKTQKIPLDLTVPLFTNYDMQDSLDFLHRMINHKLTQCFPRVQEQKQIFLEALKLIKIKISHCHPFLFNLNDFIIRPM